MNKFDEMRVALEEARKTMRAADHCADQMADLLVGRLKRVSNYTLSQLKRELRDYNIHTGSWK